MEYGESLNLSIQSRSKYIFQFCKLRLMKYQVRDHRKLIDLCLTTITMLGELYPGSISDIQTDMATNKILRILTL